MPLSSARAPTNDPTDEQDRRKPGLRARLHAWWEGVDPPPVEESPVVVPQTVVIEPTSDEQGWTEDRVEIAQLIWGSDATDPGGPEKVWEMVKPMGLDNTNTLLDMSAGLGGAARLIASKAGPWVTGMEPSKTLAKQGMRRSKAAGLNKKAPVKYYDPDALDLPQRAYDAVVAKEVFFTAKNKEALFTSITESLKNGGQIVFTDYLLREPGLDREPHVARWIESEPAQPHLWAISEVVHFLRTMGLEVRVTEDVSDEYRRTILVGMAALQEKRKHIHKLEKKVAEALVEEAELWARRVEVLDSGHVRVYRIYARKPEVVGEPGRTLSDW